jgi:cephalosporin hydroxylase
MKNQLENFFLRLARRFLGSRLKSLLDDEFVSRTDNYGGLTWLGNPIWQNVADLWVIQEVISSLKPSLIIETGTNRGGSSLFYAHLMDLLGEGEIITIDVERLHNLYHPRIRCLQGSSTSEKVLSVVRAAVANTPGNVLVILDSDHSEAHVRDELEVYHQFVNLGSYLHVQDGVIDTLPRFEAARPGPLPAIENFLRSHSEFTIDNVLCEKFPISHHPKGWLKRQ